MELKWKQCVKIAEKQLISNPVHVSVVQSSSLQFLVKITCISNRSSSPSKYAYSSTVNSQYLEVPSDQEKYLQYWDTKALDIKGWLCW